MSTANNTYKNQINKECGINRSMKSLKVGEGLVFVFFFI